MNLSLIPKDSIIQQFLTLGKFTEIPYSYLTAIGLSGISHLLKRNVIFKVGKMQVTPNLSVMLIGLAGVGKGQAMTLGQKYFLKPFSPERQVRGATSEGIAQHFYDVHRTLGEDPACGYLIYGELASGVGKKDYQQGLIPTLTDILSDEDSYSHATRHDPIIIPRPTLVVQAGSTPQWFHRLPQDAIEGGFLPRFLIVSEDEGRPPIPRPEEFMDADDYLAEKEAEIDIKDFVYWLLDTFKGPQPYYIFFEVEAGQKYDQWYCNRFNEFGPLIKGYAQRSRAAVARLAMLMAISRRKKMITMPDVDFALGFLRYNMERLETAMLPPTDEARCVEAIVACLPATSAEMIKVLRPKFNSSLVTKTLMMLRDTKEVTIKLANGEQKWYNNRTAKGDA